MIVNYHSVRFRLQILSFIILLNFSALFAGGSAKNNELAILFGGSYYTGELNYEKHFRQMSPSAGLGFRMNIDSRWAIRGNLLYLKAKGIDTRTRYGFPVNRGQSFSSNLYELSAIGEFNFFPFSTADAKSYGATPFLYFGMGLFYHNPKGSTVGLDINDFGNIVANIPFGFGFKFKASQRIILSIEYGPRKTYTDHIDAAATIYPDRLQFGHEFNKDWYAFIGAGISIRLGHKFNDCWGQ